MPGRGGFDLVLEDGGKLDRRMMTLSVYCRGWKVANPLSEMVARALGSWDRDGQLGGAPGGPLIRFRATHALATMRCVEVKEMKTRCLTRTAIDGEATIVREGVPARSAPVSIEVEHQQNIRVCNGLAQGTGLSGRAVSIALVEKLNAFSEAQP